MNDGTLGPRAMGVELRVVAEITDFGVHVTVGDRSAAEQIRTAAVAPVNVHLDGTDQRRSQTFHRA